MSSSSAISAESAKVGSSSSRQTRKTHTNPTQRIPIVVCVTAVITASVLCPLVWWRASRPANCGGRTGVDDDDSTIVTIRGRPSPQIALDPSLKFVAVVFRHGDRTPGFNYTNDPYKYFFREGKNELTKRGKQHMYKKGQIIRHLYNGFLSNQYLDKEIITKTTNTSRTYMSAAMVLAGLYPPRDYQKWSDFETVWQPIPIYHDSPDDSDKMSKRELCPTFNSTFNQTIEQIYNNTDKNFTAPILSYLSEKCGRPLNITTLYFLLDTLKCQVAENLQLPEWLTKPNYFQTIKSIFEMNKFTKTYYGNNTLQKFTVGRLLREIVLEMESRSNNSGNKNTTRKMHLYSGHDITISMILGSMDTFHENIDFGFSVHFHLHFDEKVGYYVKVFYFDRWDDKQGKEVTIPKCGDICKLQNFTQLVERSFVTDWKKECQE